MNFFILFFALPFFNTQGIYINASRRVHQKQQRYKPLSNDIHSNIKRPAAIKSSQPKPQRYGTFDSNQTPINRTLSSIHKTLTTDIIQSNVLHYCNLVSFNNLLSTNKFINELCQDHITQQLQVHFNALCIDNDTVNYLMGLPKNLLHPTNIFSIKKKYRVFLGIDSKTNSGYIRFKLIKFDNDNCCDTDFRKVSKQMVILLDKDQIHQVFKDKELMVNTSLFYDKRNILSLFANEKIVDDHHVTWYLGDIPCINTVGKRINCCIETCIGGICYCMLYIIHAVMVVAAVAYIVLIFVTIIAYISAVIIDIVN